MQWLMLQQEKPDDFVIATGVQYSVRDFVNKSAACLGLTIEWRGKAESEEGFVSSQASGFVKDGTNLVGKRILAVDSRYYRPAEVETLLGDPSKAKTELGWEPKIMLDELVKEMVEVDLGIACRDALIQRHGYQTFSHDEP